MARYLWLGDAAITVEFGNDISLDLHRQVRAFCRALEADPPPSTIELIPTYRSATVLFDPLHPEASSIEGRLREAEARATSMELDPGKLHVIPVHYGGDDGPDLADVAALHGLTPEQVIALHANHEYVVYAIGFSPGFAYLGGLPPELHTPRLGTPRKLVPAGSAAIGGQQTAVYPVPTPGGWRLLGRTSFTFFDVSHDPPCPLQAGDRVLFQPVDRLPPGDSTRMQPPASQAAGEPTLEVLKPGLFTTVQDLGRWGYQAYGVTVAGAMDPLALRRANSLAGNEPSSAALELTLLGPTLRASRACTVALAGATMPVRVNGRPLPAARSIELRAGDVLEIGRASAGVRAYLAIAGGVDVPPVLGSRSTYTRAGLGGLQGRALRAGDVLTIGDAGPPASTDPPEDVPLPQGSTSAIRVILGPQHDHFSQDTLAEFLNTDFLVSGDADRMGYRLTGHTLAHQGSGEIVSDGVALGSIQVPPHGHPIVMLADRASMGGYPKIATVISADVRLVAQTRPGMRLRFREVTVAEAWQALREEGAGPARLPVDGIRKLVAAMQRSQSTEIALDTPALKVRLHRSERK